jgi:3-methylfumaryl-CoA hydratase
VDVDHLRQWIGRVETRGDRITPFPMAALSATLDRDDPSPRAGDPLPPLWHWLYFLPLHRQSELGPDGHARLGGFLPPVPLPRRMYAGGRVELRQPLRVGDPIVRKSRIVDVNLKKGRSGDLVFVRVSHDILSDGQTAVVEEQDLVYRDNPNPVEERRPEGPDLPRWHASPVQAAWTRTVRADEVLLFRYSALTFNGFRPHYDRRFATEVQGYPGLVVHAPLIATLLADLIRRHAPAADVASFSFRAVRALFDNAPFIICGVPDDEGRSVKLWAADDAGLPAFEATAALR